MFNVIKIDFITKYKSIIQAIIKRDKEYQSVRTKFLNSQCLFKDHLPYRSKVYQQLWLCISTLGVQSIVNCYNKNQWFKQQKIK